MRKNVKLKPNKLTPGLCQKNRLERILPLLAADANKDSKSQTSENNKHVEKKRSSKKGQKKNSKTKGEFGA